MKYDFDKIIDRSNTEAVKYQMRKPNFKTNEGEDWLEQVKTYIENNIKYVYNYIQENIPAIKVKMPQSTFLMWLDFRGLNLDGEELTQFLIKEAKLGLNAGETFGEGYERFARLNVATPRSILEKAMDQLKNAVDKMNV